MKKSIYLFVIVVLVLLLTACGTGDESMTDGERQFSNVEINIALQYGLAYAPANIIKEQNLLEKYLPGATINWKQFGSGPAINEALIAGELDIGFMGVAPFFIGWDKGAPWKLATASASSPLGLQTYREDINSLTDFGPGDKIALPSPGSIQHILLSMAAEKELGDATALDQLLIAMTHPDGALSLINQQEGVDAHFTSPPYLFEELKAEGIRQIVDAEDAFGGEFTFIVGVATENFYKENPLGYAAFIAAMNDAITFINENPRDAAEILSTQYELPAETLYEYITWPGTNYTSTPYGLTGFAEFMKNAGYISRNPETLSEIAWPNVLAAIGKKSGGLSPVEAAQNRQ